MHCAITSVKLTLLSGQGNHEVAEELLNAAARAGAAALDEPDAVRSELLGPT